MTTEGDVYDEDHEDDEDDDVLDDSEDTDDFTRCLPVLQHGDFSYVNELYDEAIECYTKVLKKTERSIQTDFIIDLRFNCYLHRAVAYPKLYQQNLLHQQKLYELSAKDFQRVIEMLDKFDKRRGMEYCTLHMIYRQYGIVLYELQKYKEAQIIFEQILHETLYKPDNHKYNKNYFQNYIQQCQKHQQEQQQQQQQQEEAVAAQKRKHENEPISMDISPSTPPTTTPAPAPVTVVPAAAATTTTTTITPNIKTKTTMMNDDVTVKINPATLLLLTPKYQYYQNDTQMIIQILEPNVMPSNFIVEYVDTQNIIVRLQKQEHTLTIIQGELYDTINPEQTKIIYKSDKIVLKLRKERSNYEWQTLLSKTSTTTKKAKNTKTSTTTAAATAAATTTTTPPTTTSSNDTAEADNTSNTKIGTTTTIDTNTVPPKVITKIPKPYASHRDWDAIEKDVTAEIDNETPVGDAAMNQLFQQIYANADDDTKRAMIKSYQTSGGTVLSTNWNEVAQKDYEANRTAPDGQEWKTWEGKKLS